MYMHARMWTLSGKLSAAYNNKPCISDRQRASCLQQPLHLEYEGFVLSQAGMPTSSSRLSLLRANP